MKKLLFIILLITHSNLQSQAPYTILISFDGFRWDYANRGITPNLNKLAEAEYQLYPCDQASQQKHTPFIIQLSADATLINME